MNVISLDELIRLGITPQDISRLLGTTETKKSKVFLVYDQRQEGYRGVFSSKDSALAGIKKCLGEAIGKTEILSIHPYGGSWERDPNFAVTYRLSSGYVNSMYIEVWEVDKVTHEPPRLAGDEE